MRNITWCMGLPGSIGMAFVTLLVIDRVLGMSVIGELVILFLQAEDGIRDLTVTGVQTCALPISDGPLAVEAAHASLAPFQRAWTFTGADRRCHLDPRTASGCGRPSDPWPLGRRSAGRRDRKSVV